MPWTPLDNLSQNLIHRVFAEPLEHVIIPPNECVSWRFLLFLNMAAWCIIHAHATCIGHFRILVVGIARSTWIEGKVSSSVRVAASQVAGVYVEASLRRLLAWTPHVISRNKLWTLKRLDNSEQAFLEHTPVVGIGRRHQSRF